MGPRFHLTLTIANDESEPIRLDYDTDGHEIHISGMLYPRHLDLFNRLVREVKPMAHEKPRAKRTDD